VPAFADRPLLYVLVGRAAPRSGEASRRGRPFLGGLGLGTLPQLSASLKRAGLYSEALGGRVDIEDLEPPVEELADGCSGARIAFLINLVQ
jgi:hypothetical protein